MVLRPRIVFLIDRYQGEYHDSLKSIIANINLSCLRILCYYDKQSSCMRGSKPSSILWGYKFFNSARQLGSYHMYKHCQFLDYVTSNFDKFESELYDGITSDETTSETNVKPGEKLKVALTEIITDFQWDRPELFSPGKLGKSDHHETEYNNLLFLFSNCPSGFNDSYFNQCYVDPKGFIDGLFPEGLYKKFVRHLKIKLCWVDTGVCISNIKNEKIKDNDHVLISDGLKRINGCFVEMKNLTSWWICTDKNKKDEYIYKDVLNVSSLVGCLLDNVTNDKNIDILRCFWKDCQENRAMISLSTINSKHDSLFRITDEVQLQIGEEIDFDSISLCTLKPDQGFFFFINPELPCNKYLLQNLQETCLTTRIYMIQLCSLNSDAKLHAYMIPYAPYFGTIIPFCPDLLEKAYKNRYQPDFIDDIIDDLEMQLRDHLNNMKYDFGTSLVNSVDTWFLSNPKLGCPIEIKNLLCSLYSDRLAMLKRRDNKSKILVEYMKENTNFELNTQQKYNKSENEHTSISLGKQRLKKFRNRNKFVKCDEKENIGTDDICEENNTSEVFVESSRELPTEENLNDTMLTEYEVLLQRSLSPTNVKNMLNVVVQYFKSIDSDTYKEASFSFLSSSILRNVEEIRDKNIDSPKDELVKEYLLQVQIYLECIHQLCPTDSETILKRIVTFLRTVSFEKSAAYVSKHLNETILPRFPDITEFLREIYENLMLDFPEDLEESRNMDDDISIKSVESSSVKSYCSSEYSPSSVQAEKRTIRRISSLVGDNANKKVIAVQTKKPNKKKKNSSEDKAVKRTLFTQQPPTSNILATPKPLRRHSESNIKKKVPDTPETRQINDMMWKKLERKRRYSNIDKRMISIEESPIKELASPIKRHSTFYRSSSFNCHTSPRRFYKIQRHPSMIVGSHGFSKNAESAGTIKSNSSFSKKVSPKVLASPLEVKLRRRSTLFSNFDDDDICESDQNYKSNENQVVPIANEENELSQPVSRRKIFENGNTPVKLITNDETTNQVDEHVSKRLKLSPSYANNKDDQMTTPVDKSKKRKFTRFNSEMNTVIELSSMDDVEPIYMTETTVDWLTEIEKDQSNTPTNFRDAFAKLSNTPMGFQSPAVIKAGNESISVSPCLSASSVEVLERAPIISPVISKRKIRKGRTLNVEYE